MIGHYLFFVDKNFKILAALYSLIKTSNFQLSCSKSIVLIIKLVEYDSVLFLD